MTRKIYDKPSTKEKRKRLRENQTKAEKILWGRLRNRRFQNLKFRRQYGIEEYIVDFYCSKLKLVIEVDGAQHYSEDGLEYDRTREKFMESLGIKTIRFTNLEVEEDVGKVIDRLKGEFLESI